MRQILLIIMLLPVLMLAGTIEMQINLQPDNINGFTTAPGRMRVPVKTLNILLPPGAEIQDYQLDLNNPVPAPRNYQEINPAWSDGQHILSASRTETGNSGYRYLGSKRWGDLTYASWQVLPYEARSNNWYSKLDLSISYTEGVAARNLIPTTFNIPGFFANSGKLKDWYQTPQGRNYDYLVVSTPALYAQLGDWQAYRQSQGMVIQFADISNILSSELGDNDADKLRNYLITQYAMHPFTYLLLVGDYDTVPVAYLTPEPNGSDTVPSDFFYGDLSSNWDSDNDGRYGEYFNTPGVDDWQVDYSPEVFVGRISSNIPSEVASIASRIVSFDSSSDPFKQKALLPAAFLNYQDEPDTGMPQTDGAVVFELAVNTVLRDYDCDTLYEQFGVVSSYPSDYPLDQSNFNTLLRGTDYGLINWSAHGSPSSSSRKVWVEDDGDNIPEYWEMQWMDLVDKQSFDGITSTEGSVIFAASCYNGYIDDDESSLAEYALIQKAVGVLAATRTGWYKVGWQNPGWGGLTSYNYHFLENYSEQGHSLGAAHAYTNLIHTQYYLFGDPIDSGGIIWPELQNVYTYLLYGDPAIGHSIDPAPQGEILVYVPVGEADYRIINSIRDNLNLNVIYSNRLIPDYNYIQNFEAIFCIMDDYQLSSWEYDLLNGYLEAGGRMYLEGNVNWDSSDAFLGKFGVEAPLDNVITIEGIKYSQQNWDYAAQANDYRVLIPVGNNPQIVFWTNNVMEADYSIGVRNDTDTYCTIASSFHLREVMDDIPNSPSDSFPELIAVILNELGLSVSSTINDVQAPEAVPTLSVWPNPSRGLISIHIQNPQKAESSVRIFNIKGQKLMDLELSAKNGYTQSWNGRDANGKACPAGVYIIKSGNLQRKITLVR
ncbi:MAG: C25 family cysteine peptidase [Candidatus Cloacimonetes bacterium]|nr:C25 family cysteine peptidase [Candidatus Cloacimonadota bacterium]